jgi:ferric-dicitrate binding protein FerR (iron transport regulator)
VQSVPVKKDIAAPTSNRATLTLSSGNIIYLDSTAKGILASQGNVNIQKTENGEIVYTGKSNSKEVEYNTLTNPRGSEVASIVLSDGSKVFLNAESSLTYPVFFARNERKVEITGEAYFEVAKDPAKKFMVTGNGVTTEVLGTHFNVNTYKDEASIKVTLLEGSVKVSAGAHQNILKPGQQAAIANDEIEINRAVDINQVMAWKNGIFNFENMTVDQAMRQLARWYDIDFVYDKKVPDTKLTGKMDRFLTLQQALSGLDGLVAHFKIEGRTVHISPL